MHIGDELRLVQPHFTPCFCGAFLLGETISKQHWDSWYNKPRWKRLRQWQLNRQPLCQISLALGIVTIADVVDHKKPHKGDEQLFWDLDNVHSVSKLAHDTICQQMECGTWQPPIGLDGWPVENEYLNQLFSLKKPQKGFK